MAVDECVAVVRRWFRVGWLGVRPFRVWAVLGFELGLV